MVAYDMYVLSAIGNHIVLIVAPSEILQKSADAKCSLDFHTKQKKLHNNIFESYFHFKPSYRKTSQPPTNRHAKSQHQACSRFGGDMVTKFATRY